MKKLFNSLLIGLVSIMFFTMSVSATLSTIVTAQPPAWGGIQDVMSTYVVKTTSSSSVSFYGVKESNALNPSGKLINSNHDSRSDWVTISQNQTFTSQSNVGAVNYQYYSSVKTNILEPNSNIIQYQFNPY